jgi:hypothetical protein
LNLIQQNNEVVNIAIHGQNSYDVSRRNTNIEILKQLLENEYPNSNLIIEKNKYGDTIDISIVFPNIEIATHFKLTYMLINNRI